MRKYSPKLKDLTNQRGFRNRSSTEAQQHLAKNANQAFVMLALFNVVKWNRPLTE